MTLIRKPARKAITLPVTSDLSTEALEQAIEIARNDPHDGWADVVVHPSKLRDAMMLAGAHNALEEPGLLVRVLAENRMGMDDWKLETRTVVVTSYWTHRT